jgi:hypothetical protein
MREPALTQASNDPSAPCTRIMSLRTKSGSFVLQGAAVPTLAYDSLRLRPRMLGALREGALSPTRIGRFEKIGHVGVLLDHAPVAMGLNHRLHVGNLMADDDEEAA